MLTECAALHAIRNRTALFFQTVELPITEYDIFRISIPPPYLEPEMERKIVEFFFRFGVPDYETDGMNMCKSEVKSTHNRDIDT
jgi:hypothetical protein